MREDLLKGLSEEQIEKAAQVFPELLRISFQDQLLLYPLHRIVIFPSEGWREHRGCLRKKAAALFYITGLRHSLPAMLPVNIGAHAFMHSPVFLRQIVIIGGIREEIVHNAGEDRKAKKAFAAFDLYPGNGIPRRQRRWQRAARFKMDHSIFPAGASRNIL